MFLSWGSELSRTPRSGQIDMLFVGLCKVCPVRKKHGNVGGLSRKIRSWDPPFYCGTDHTLRVALTSNSRRVGNRVLVKVGC